MNRKPNISDDPAELRRRAEARLRDQRKGQRSKAGDQKSQSDTVRVLHELEVHQIELEMQNAELQKARDELEAALEKYTDLYDFSPVGYFTLAADSTIQLVNLTGARLVGSERSRLVGRPFELLLSAELRPVFNAFLKQVFAGQTKQAGDFELLRKGQPPRVINIEAQRSANGRECRAGMVDITDRKQAEDALRESEKRFRVMANAMPQLAWIARPDGHIIWYNQRWYDYTGTTPEQMEGWGWQSVHNAVELPKVLDRWKASIATGDPFDMTFPLRGADGKFRPFLTRVIPLKNAAKRVVQWFGTNTDVNDLKQAEDKVRVSEIRYRRLFEATRDGVLLLDPGTRKITDANPFMTKLLGYAHEQLIGKELFEIGLLKDEVASQEMFQKLKRTHEVRYEDLPLESQGGRHQEVEVVASLYQENDHSVIQCNIRDITERKLAEEALRTSEERYRTLFDLGPVAVYSCDSSGVIQNFNLRAAELWGRAPASGDTDERFCGSFKLFRPDGSFMPHKQCPMAQVLSGKIPAMRDGEVNIERPDGSRITVVMNIRSLKNKRGEVRGAINCFYDITERKAAEKAQRRMDVLTASNRKLEQEIVRRQAVEESLQKSERHQGELLVQSRSMQGQLRHLSHQILHAQEEERKSISRELHDEIAQTLVGINVHLAALSREAAGNPGSLRQKIARTQRLVEKSVDIVHRFARELRPTVLDDLGLIPALHAFMKEFTKRTGIHIRFTTFTSSRIKQLNNATRTAFYRVAQEALTNVARHARASLVEVNIEKLPNAICLKIKDNGKSFQAQRVMHSKQNTRLGLIGMRERLEMVGGTFSVESASDKGTTVRAQIPLGKAARVGQNSADGIA